MPNYNVNKQHSILDNQLYFDVLESKGVKQIKILKSTNFEKLIGLSINIEKEHIWSSGDTLFKLARSYFGSYQYWWVIALLNGKPTDAHYSIGDVIYIPTSVISIEEALR